MPAPPLDYASPPPSSPSSPPRRGGWRAVVGWILFTLCLLLSLHVAALSINTALGHHGQGHEDGFIERGLIVVVDPVELLLAGGCWWGCRLLRVGWRVSGAVLGVALVVWIGALVRVP